MLSKLCRKSNDVIILLILLYRKRKNCFATKTKLQCYLNAKHNYMSNNPLKNT